MDNRFSIDVEKFDNLENIKIIMENFNFVNSQELEITINLIVSIDWINNPPSLFITSNKILKDNILQIIEKLEPFSDVKSWSIKYSIFDTIVNIHNMINKFAEIYIDNPDVLETCINELEYLFSIKSINVSSTKLLELFDKELVKVKGKNKDTYKVKDPDNNQYWKKGTGYGYDGNSSNWDIEQYVNNLNNKKKNISIKMKEFIFNINKDNIKIHLDKIIELSSLYMNDDEISNEIVFDIATIITKYFSPNSNLLNKDNHKPVSYTHLTLPTKRIV